MRTLIAFDHPYKGNNGNTIVQSVRQRLLKADQEVDLIGLEKDGFNPAITQEEGFKAFEAYHQIIDYKTRLRRADHLLFIFPAGWNIIPATIRGFINRVLFSSTVYNNRPRDLEFILPLKNITVMTTAVRLGIMYKFPISNLIRRTMIRSIFKTMGYKNVHWISLECIKRVKQEKLMKWLAGIENRFAKIAI